MSTDVAPPLAAGRLRLRQVLGKGGVGTVYLAYDERLDVHRAVKILAEERADHAVQRQRFLTEARIQARLRHPNVVEVYDIEDDGTRVYLVMELVPGGSLWDRLQVEGPLPAERAAELIAGILAGLAQAHDLDIVHRDIKPHNILLSESGVPKLADFGVAQLCTPEQHDLTRTGMVMGTWAFMAPEQRVSSRRVDRRSDIYGAGATLYALIAGRAEADLFDFDPGSPAYAPIPPALRPVIRRATRYARSERYQDAREMREDLERARVALTAPAPAPAPPPDPEDAPEPSGLFEPPAPAPDATQDPAGERDEPLLPGNAAGTLVPSIAEVQRLLATPAGRAGQATFSDAGQTVELPRRAGATRPEPAAPPVPVPISSAPGEPAPGHGEIAHASWSLADEERLSEQAIAEDAEEVRTGGGRRRFWAFAAVLLLGSVALLAWREGLLPAGWPGADREEPPAVPEPQPEAKRHARVPAEPPAPAPEPPPLEPAPTPGETPSAAPPAEGGTPAEGGPPAAPEPPPAEPQGADATFPEIPEGSAAALVHRLVGMRHEAEIMGCYEEALASNGALEGRLRLRWGVEDGRIYSVVPVEIPGNHADLGACAVEAVQGWTYPAWFDATPGWHDWTLSVASRGQSLVNQRQSELGACTSRATGAPAPEPRAVRVDFTTLDGVVVAASMTGPSGDPGLDACWLETVHAWRFPRWVSGTWSVQMSLQATEL